MLAPVRHLPGVLCFCSRSARTVLVVPGAASQQHYSISCVLRKSKAMPCDMVARGMQWQHEAGCPPKTAGGLAVRRGKGVQCRLDACSRVMDAGGDTSSRLVEVDEAQPPHPRTQQHGGSMAAHPLCPSTRSPHQRHAPGKADDLPLAAQPAFRFAAAS